MSEGYTTRTRGRRRRGDHFLILRFKATNEEPYPFEWVNAQQMIRDYGAILVRLSAEYDLRF